MNLNTIDFVAQSSPFPPRAWTTDLDGQTITVTSIAGTDIFTDPGGTDAAVTSQTLHNAATLLTTAPEGDFQLSARVTVDFNSTFDAGALFIRHTERLWAKLCFEYSPAGEAMVVSVVTHGVSDDANAFTVQAPTIFLRVSRKGGVYAFHASSDGNSWTFVRAFALIDAPARVDVGLEAQSPNGHGCHVTFADVSLRSATITDFRDGN